MRLVGQAPWVHGSAWIVARPWVIALFVAFGVVTLVAATEPGAPLNPYRVTITSVLWAEGGQALSSGPGFSPQVGEKFTLVLVFGNAGFAPVQFRGAVPNPPFSLLSASLPSIPAFGTERLSVTLAAPHGDYDGPLTITLN